MTEPRPDLFDPQVLAKLSPRDLKVLIWQQTWLNTARKKQLPPDDPEWTEWGMLMGRGAGKSLSGANWLAIEALTDPLALPSYVIAPTLNDVRYTCFEGHTGILNIIPQECIKDYNKTNLIITLDNGATIRGFSAEEPERLRGPQAARAWCFPGRTKVLMADGSTQRIDSIVKGQMVATRFGPRRVLAAKRSANDKPLVELEFGRTKLTATIDHPILANGRWRAAGEIKAGDELCAIASADAPWLFTTASVRSVRSAISEPVYDLAVEDVHEFIAEGVVVHNCDEIAAWGAHDEATFDMMQFGLRLGPKPRLLWTTTPKPRELIRKLVAPKPGRFIVTGSTYENRANLPKSFFDQLAQYEGTQLGRQELEGELIDAEEGGVIQRKWLRRWPHGAPLPAFEYLVMSLDTAFTEKTIERKNHDPDPTACGVWGVFWHEKRARVMLLDAWADHLGFPDLVRRVKRERQAAYGDDAERPMLKPLFGPQRLHSAGRRPDIVLIEDKGSGISLRQALEQDGVATFPYNPGRADKLQRLHMVSHLFAQGLVYIPESERRPGQFKTWAEPVVQQLCAYRGPGSIRHDDHVDQTTQCLRLLHDKGLLTTAPPSAASAKDDPRHDPLDSPAPRTPRVNPYAA